MNSGELGKTYAKGEVIVRQGDSGDCMFAIQNGRLEVIMNGPQGEVRTAILEAGDIFGEMAIFEREVRSATVRALEEARVLTVDKKTFLRRVQEDPSLAFNLVKMMSARIRRMSIEIAGLKPGTVARIQDTLALTDTERQFERRVTPERRRTRDRRMGDRRHAGASPQGGATAHENRG
jgi:CRP-like cAMP-binding protein